MSRDPIEIRRAREWTAVTIERELGVTRDETADLMIMVSELVTNVLRHTASRPVITLRRSTGRLLVEVRDNDPMPPHMRQGPPSPSGGMGLRLVDRMAEDWGVRQIPGRGKVVWFTVRI